MSEKWMRESRARAKRRDAIMRSENALDPDAPGKHVLAFGRHKGKTVAQVGIEDPEYLRWALRELAGKPVHGVVRRYLESRGLESLGPLQESQEPPRRDAAPDGPRRPRARKNDVSASLGAPFELALREVERLAALGLRPGRALDVADFVGLST